MRVIDFEPNSWFLFENDNCLLFNVNCNHGNIGYDFTVELSSAEKNEYEVNGRQYLRELANAIDYSAPISTESNSAFKGRSVDSQYSDLMMKTINSWRSENDNT